jgi:hypothetical protein
LSDEERGRHDPIRGVAQEEASGAPPQDIWVHRVCVEHGAVLKKLEDHSQKMIFIGYVSGSKA